MYSWRLQERICVIDMKQLIRMLYYFAKEILLDFSFSFWTLFFPILLGTLFYLAFGKLDNRQLDPIPVAVVDNSMAATIIQQVDIFDITLVESDEAGKELLLDKKSEAYIDAEFALSLNKSTGLKPTIVRRVIDQIVRAKALGVDAMHLDFSHEYTQTLNQEGSFLTVAFYALIASICFYAMFSSIYMCTTVQPNLSDFGARLAMTPLTKGMLLSVSFLVSFMLNLLANLIFVAYVMFVLKVPIFQEVGLSILLLAIGNLTATAFGFAIGYSNRLPLEAKSNITLLVNMILSAFAGMMGPQPRMFIEQVAPIISEWNPIGLVTNTLMRMNRLAQPETVWIASAALLLYGAIAYGIAYSFLRRVQYDSV